MNSRQLVSWCLRGGLAFALLYPAISAWFEPASWIGYFPEMMRGIVPDEILLHSFGALEIVLALWILSGKRLLVPALVVAALLVAIVGFNISQMEVVFRDISIALMALALAFIPEVKSKESIPVDIVE